jgi:hypothetical protein
MEPECPRRRAGKWKLSQSHNKAPDEPESIPTAHLGDTIAEETTVPAWEMIEAGRYMPRRIRGSFPGRELG